MHVCIGNCTRIMCTLITSDMICRVLFAILLITELDFDLDFCRGQVLCSFVGGLGAIAPTSLRPRLCKMIAMQFS
jgi:hypothetical protein